jgi:hypothetical protein
MTHNYRAPNKTTSFALVSQFGARECRPQCEACIFLRRFFEYRDVEAIIRIRAYHEQRGTGTLLMSNGAAEKRPYPADRRDTNLLRRESRDPVPIIRGFRVSRTESPRMTKERASRAATLRIYRARTSPQIYACPRRGT